MLSLIIAIFNPFGGHCPPYLYFSFKIKVMINTYLEKLLLISGILYFNSLYFSILPLKVLAQNTVNITTKASLQLMIKGIKFRKTRIC
jgi:hypothetical protein